MRPRPAILLYHRVATPRFDPWGIAISPAHFEEQVRWLARHRHPLTLDAFVDALAAGTLSPHAVAVTFDDGYLDNLLHAYPVLQRERVPATLFLATGFTAEGRRFWWDLLADALLASIGEADWTLETRTATFVCAWRATEVASPGWRAWQPPPGPREAAFLAIWTHLQRLSESERSAALEEILCRFPVAPEPDARAMREDEVRRILCDGVFSVGAHSVTHPALTSLDTASLKQELSRSRAVCDAISGRPTRFLAYPYGDMDVRVQAAAAEAGFAAAFSTEASSPTRLQMISQPMAIPRIVPPSAGRHALARALRAL
ncbi:polysaccharide deacetylase family protein [Methylobacterium sp. P31]